MKTNSLILLGSVVRLNHRAAEFAKNNEPEAKVPRRMGRPRGSTRPSKYKTLEGYAFYRWQQLMASPAFQRNANHNWLHFDRFVDDVGLPTSFNQELRKDTNHRSYTKFSVVWIDPKGGSMPIKQKRIVLKVFVPESHVAGTGVAVYPVGQLGYGITIPRNEISQAIMSGKILPSFITERDIKVIEEEEDIT